MATTPKFDKCIDFVLDHEGYRADDPKDPGGLTIWGISMRYEKELCTKIGDLPREEAKAIARQYYFDTYWQKCHGEDHPIKIAIVLLDGAVNQGANIMDRWQDGLGDQVTADKLICWRMCRYIERVNSTPAMSWALHGWMNRLCDLYRKLKEL